MVSSRTIGAISLVVILACWFYYTVWILITPIVDSDHPLQNYFPDRMMGIMTTTLLGYCQVAFMLTSAGIILVRDSTLQHEYEQQRGPTKASHLPNRKGELLASKWLEEQSKKAVYDDIKPSRLKRSKS